jgi:sugar lactone lactonase YvrE
MANASSSIRQTDFLTYSHTVGLCTMEGRGFMFPVDTAIGAGNRLFSVSRGVPGDTRSIRVTTYDLESQFFGTFGGFGEGDGQFIWPSAIAIDSAGNVYVSDEHKHKINVFTGEGIYTANWGDYGEGEGQLNGPSGLAFDSEDNLLVSDHRNHRVQKFNRDGQFISAFGVEGSGSGQLSLPWGVAVDSNSDIYVADWGNNRIQKFSAEGEFLRSYGSTGHEDGQLINPSGVAVDRDGYLYVSDWGNERVQVLSKDGDFVAKLRGQATVSKWAQDFLDTNVEEAEARANSNLEPDLTPFGGDPHEESSHTEKFFWGPASVKLDAEGRLYVTESNRHRIQIYQRAT